MEVAYDPNEGALLSHEEILKARVLDTESSFDRAQSVDEGHRTNYKNYINTVFPEEHLYQSQQAGTVEQSLRLRQPSHADSSRKVIIDDFIS